MATGTRAVTAVPIEVPPLGPGDPPIALLLDYDGTIALTDVADTVMAEFVTGEWETEAALYDAGLVGSRRLMQLEMELLRGEPGALMAFALAQPHDPMFVPLVNRARAARVPVEIVSDGFGFYIQPALERLGAPWVPVATAATTFSDGRASIDFPNGHPRCFVCGTCKRERVLEHRAAGRLVVFVGDGESDRYAAGYADVVFAKRALIKICVERGWPFHRWAELREVDQWLSETLERWARDGSLPPSIDRPFSCGPEVWGDGRWDPPRDGRDRGPHRPGDRAPLSG